MRVRARAVLLRANLMDSCRARPGRLEHGCTLIFRPPHQSPPSPAVIALRLWGLQQRLQRIR